MAGVRRSLNAIGNEIKAEWPNMYFGAVPYVEAMRQLNTMGDWYGQDSAYTIVAYFLANAATWRGETARRIKAELRDMAK